MGSATQQACEIPLRPLEGGGTGLATFNWSGGRGGCSVARTDVFKGETLASKVDHYREAGSGIAGSASSARRSVDEPWWCIDDGVSVKFDGEAMVIRVVVADDDNLVRTGIVMILQSTSDIDVVGEATDGRGAVELARELQPDVVVMDVRMPLMSGVEATELIVSESREDPLVHVLALTTFHTEDAVYGAIQAGASGFVLKAAAPDELAMAVRAIAEGEAWLDPAVAKGVLADLAARPRSAGPGNQALTELTPREVEVLVEVAHGFSNGQIARRLFVGEATVKTHVSRVLMKLGLKDRAQAVGVAYRTGLVAPSDPPPPPRGVQ